MADYAAPAPETVAWEQYAPRRGPLTAALASPMARLAEVCRAMGLKVEIVPGAETRSAGSFNFKGSVCHWTAGPRGTTTRPSLNICINGRPGLSGPLCNDYLDRQGTVVIVAYGRANHAGTGGWNGLVGNSAVLGTEAESGGNNDWTDAQRWAYPRLQAAHARVLGTDQRYICGHNEWAPTRKIDINDWPMSLMRQQVGQILTGEDDMALSNEDKQWLLTELVKANVHGIWGYQEPGMKWAASMGRRQAGTDEGVVALTGLVQSLSGQSNRILETLTGSHAALSNTLANVLAKVEASQGLTESDLAEIRRVLQEATVAVDVTVRNDAEGR